MLSPEESYQFDLQGYCVARNALSTELIDELEAKLIEFEDRAKDQLPANCIPSWTPLLNEYRIMNIIELGNPFLGMIDHAEILARVTELVPGPIRLTEAYSISRGPSMGMYIHRNTPPIADYSVTPSGPRATFLKAIVNLTDVGPDDGPFVVFEGTHKLGVPFPYSEIHPDWTPPPEVGPIYKMVPEGVISRRWEDIPGYREVCVRRGDVVFFTENLYHGAKELRSDRTRRTLYYSYSPYHFVNWHGVVYSDELKREASPRQRELLSGPYAGFRFEGAEPSDLPGTLPFPYHPNSPRAAERRRGR
jgi:hypothetical protein